MRQARTFRHLGRLAVGALVWAAAAAELATCHH